MSSLKQSCISFVDSTCGHHLTGRSYNDCFACLEVNVAGLVMSDCPSDVAWICDHAFDIGSKSERKGTNFGKQILVGHLLLKATASDSKEDVAVQATSSNHYVSKTAAAAAAALCSLLIVAAAARRLQRASSRAHGMHTSDTVVDASFDLAPHATANSAAL